MKSERELRHSVKGDLLLRNDVALSSLLEKQKEEEQGTISFSKTRPWTTRAARSPRSSRPTSTRGPATRCPSGANKLPEEEERDCLQRPMHRRLRRMPPVAPEEPPRRLPREGRLLLQEGRRPRPRLRPRATGGEYIRNLSAKERERGKEDVSPSQRRRRRRRQLRVNLRIRDNKEIALSVALLLFRSLSLPSSRDILMLIVEHAKKQEEKKKKGG